MSETELEQLRFPVGRWQKPESVSTSDLVAFQAILAGFPSMLRAKVEGLPDAVLDTPYRPEGWTVRQVVHHCADSHLNCLIRFKLALTEDNPTIKPYAEERWAELPDYRLPIDSSLHMLTLVHARLTHLLGSLTADQWARTYVHPQYGTVFRLDQVASLYAWHCRHHLGHVLLVVKEQG